MAAGDVAAGGVAMSDLRASLTLWTHIHHRDRRALAMADRHYSRQSPGSSEFTRPGHKIVLMHFTDAGEPAALWASQRPAPSSGIRRADGLNAWDCSLFRIEQRTAPRASDLITSAVQATVALWGEPPCDGFVTTIDPLHVAPIKRRGQETWGYSYMCAGWRFLRITSARKLIMLQLPYDQMCALSPVAPHEETTQLSLFAPDLTLA